MTGTEWIVEAHGCTSARLAEVHSLRAMFAVIIAELDLHPVGDAVWHQFPDPGGVTGMQMLAESHLTVHTFPEHASCCINLFCCTPRRTWSWDARLRELLGAERVEVRVLTRAYADVSRAVSNATANAVAR